MSILRRYRDYLAWLMSVAVACNIILAMVCCAPIGLAHSGAPGEALAGVLCTSGGLPASNPDGPSPGGHRSLHAQCVMCSHGPGGSLASLPVSVGTDVFAVLNGEAIAFQPEAFRGTSHFAFAEPSNRGPPRA